MSEIKTRSEDMNDQKTNTEALTEQSICQLFEHMATEHGLTLVDSELREIIRIAKLICLK